MASMRRTHPPTSSVPRGHDVRRALIGAAILSCVAVSEASAQFAYGYMRTYPGPAYEDELPPMPPRSVVYRLQDRGFTEIARPRFDGRAYVVEATNPVGARVRLFVDARDGGVIGRERLDTPYYPSGRVARAAPGYGWTEEDVAPRRAGRAPEGLLPPADIPLPRPALHAEIDRAPGVSSRPGASDPGTFGVNPDGRSGTRGEAAKARAAASQRKTAKLTPPVKPAAPSVSPEAPLPQTTPPEPTAKAPDTAKAVGEPAKAEPAPLTPAANQPAATEKNAASSPTETPVAEKPATDRANSGKGGAGPGWQDPPAGDPKRNVRVIGGAIVVPGGGETPPAAAN